VSCMIGRDLAGTLGALNHFVNFATSSTCAVWRKLVDRSHGVQPVSRRRPGS